MSARAACGVARCRRSYRGDYDVDIDVDHHDITSLGGANHPSTGTVGAAVDDDDLLANRQPPDHRR